MWQCSPLEIDIFHVGFSVHCWDLSDLKSISRRFSHFYHNRGVSAATVDGLNLSVANTQQRLNGTRWITAAGDVSTPNTVMERFATASDDGTVRLWSLPTNCALPKPANSNDCSRNSQEGSNVVSSCICGTLVIVHLVASVYQKFTLLTPCMIPHSLVSLSSVWL